MIDLVYKDENYYPKAFFEKYNFNGKIEIHCHDSYNVDSDEEYSDDSDDYDEKNPMKKIQMEKMYKFIFRKNKLLNQQPSQNARQLFHRNIRNFYFSDFASSLLKHEEFFLEKIWVFYAWG